MAERLRAGKALGYIPRIKHPRSLNEKLLRRKMLEPVANAHVLADKWKVRDYVRERVGDAVLNEVYLVASAPGDIRFERLPTAFVVKMNNATKRNILVHDKKRVDAWGIRATLGSWLREPYGRDTEERWYMDIEPRILVERLLEDDGRVPWDYCFHVFHGQTSYVETQIDRFGIRGENATSSNWYDLNWEVQRIRQQSPNGPVTPPPANLDEMVEIANRLGEGLGYVRVDLYSIGGKQIVFGEITITPCAGRGRFDPVEADFRLGTLW